MALSSQRRGGRRAAPLALALGADDTAVYWLEGRPEERGRTVLVRAEPGGSPEVVSPPQVSLRSRVHEYGGGAYGLLPNEGGEDRPGFVYVDQEDQRIWRRRDNAPPVPLTVPAPDGERHFYGDLRVMPDGRSVLAVREVHDPDGVTRALVAVPVDGASEPRVLFEGRDFLTSPRPDATGRWLAWVAWDHPDMSWDASELWAARLFDTEEGLELTGATRIAGGRGAASDGGGVSVGQPQWARDGSLLYVSDENGWWQPWRRGADNRARCLCDEEAEFHAPDWTLGQVTIVEVDGGLVCRRRRHGYDEVGLLVGGRFTPFDQPCVSVSGLCRLGDAVVWLGATATGEAGPWWTAGPPDRRGRGEPLVAVEPGPLTPDAVSIAEPFTVASAERTVHGLFYRPTSTEVEGPDDARPPIVVHCHGGPTGAAEASFDPVVQLLTSRGYAVAAVDYAGSSGYGRAYRQRLWGCWGIADAEDCVQVVRSLAQRGLVDGHNAAVRGGSAGGFTAFGALAASQDFRGAVSWYGVTDLVTLVASTHDFEAHYTDRLIGPLPGAIEEYRRRSPINKVTEMHGAVLVLQGTDDPVVPPDQATEMVVALRAAGVRCEYLAFEGEGHGFRRADTLEAALDAELAFYAEVLAPSVPAHRRTAVRSW